MASPATPTMPSSKRLKKAPGGDHAAASSGGGLGGVCCVESVPYVQEAGSPLSSGPPKGGVFADKEDHRRPAP
ncbi:hypothetical protein NL676_039891 [Syzygium grande]|nr:hypothetical protein NL676_039891 [Syzygium grande]